MTREAVWSDGIAGSKIEGWVCEGPVEDTPVCGIDAITAEAVDSVEDGGVAHLERGVGGVEYFFPVGLAARVVAEGFELVFVRVHEPAVSGEKLSLVWDQPCSRKQYCEIWKEDLQSNG